MRVSMSADWRNGVIMNSRVLNLGCGTDYMEGAVNVDYYSSRADVRFDLNRFPYPLDSSSFDNIYCLNIIEHLDDTVAVMNEIHRIGANLCKVVIRVPHFRSASLYEDVTHKRGFAWRSFDIFTEQSEVYGEYSNARFSIVERRYTPYYVPPLYRALSSVPILTDNLISKFVPMASLLFVLQVEK